MLKLLALGTICTLQFSLSLLLIAKADEPNQPCKAYLDTSNGTDEEENNCPITIGEFSIRGTFSNSNWHASFWAWEPAYYILYIKDRQAGSTINLTGFKVMGTTSRPQYQFTDPAQDVTYIVSFRYSDPNTIRLEVYKNNQLMINELLARDSDQLIGGP